MINSEIADDDRALSGGGGVKYERLVEISDIYEAIFDVQDDVILTSHHDPISTIQPENMQEHLKVSTAAIHTISASLPPIVTNSNKPRPRTASHTTSVSPKSPSSSAKLRPVSAVHVKHSQSQNYVSAMAENAKLPPFSPATSPTSADTPENHKQPRPKSTYIHSPGSNRSSSPSYRGLKPSSPALLNAKTTHTRSTSKSPSSRKLKYSPLPVAKPVYHVTPRIQHLLDDIRKAYDNKRIMRPFSSSVYRRPMSPLSSDKYKKSLSR
eukprot:gene24177-29240_t